MAIRVLAVGNSVTTQTDHRSLISALAVSQGNVGTRGGVFPSNPHPAILTNVSAMVVGIGAFRAIVPNTAGTGNYLVQSDAQINLTFDPGEAGVIRTDRIIVRVYNNSQDGSGFEKAEVEYLKGQASGSANPLPANSLLLWEVPVPAGASAGSGGINFTGISVDKRIRTTAAGGVIPVASNAEQDAITNAYQGMAVFNTSTNILYIHDGAIFRPRGQITVSSAGNINSIKNPDNGTIVYTRDTGVIWAYDGASWNPKSVPGKPGKASSTSTQTGVVNSELVSLTVPGFTFRSGWAYRVTIRAGLYGVAGTQCLFRLKKTNIAGASWGEFGRWTADGSSAGNTNGVHGSIIVYRTAGTDLTADAVLTVIGSHATNAVNIYAAADTPRTLLIEPIGLASDYIGQGVDVT